MPTDARLWSSPGFSNTRHLALQVPIIVPALYCAFTSPTSWPPTQLVWAMLGVEPGNGKLGGERRKSSVKGARRQCRLRHGTCSVSHYAFKSTFQTGSWRHNNTKIQIVLKFQVESQKFILHIRIWTLLILGRSSRRDINIQLQSQIQSQIRRQKNSLWRLQTNSCTFSHLQARTWFGERLNTSRNIFSTQGLLWT